MKRKGIVLVTTIGAMVLALAVSIPALTAGGATRQRPRISAGASYAPLPAAAYTGLGVSLNPLQGSQLATVQVTVSEARSVAKERLGLTNAEASNVTVLVGSFTDDEYATTDAAGVKELVADDLPAYVVTFSGLSIAAANGGPGRNTQESVVVDAASGEVVEVFSFQ